jgi:hypothetical protein
MRTVFSDGIRRAVEPEFTLGPNLPFKVGRPQSKARNSIERATVLKRSLRVIP